MHYSRFLLTSSLTLRRLGLDHVEWWPAQSDPASANGLRSAWNCPGSEGVQYDAEIEISNDPLVVSAVAEDQPGMGVFVQNGKLLAVCGVLSVQRSED